MLSGTHSSVVYGFLGTTKFYNQIQSWKIHVVTSKYTYIASSFLRLWMNPINSNYPLEYTGVLKYTEPKLYIYDTYDNMYIISDLWMTQFTAALKISLGWMLSVSGAFWIKKQGQKHNDNYTTHISQETSDLEITIRQGWI